MLALMHGRKGAALVAAFLLTQIGLLCLSMGAFWQISVFCTAPAASPWSLAFGLLHVSLLGLLLVGLLSLHFVRLRLLYIGLVTAALLTLPLQATLVSHRVLWCDGP